MIGTRDLRFDEPLPSPSSARYFATENRVICDHGGCAYLVCRVTPEVGNPDALASILADALNRIPMLAA